MTRATPSCSSLTGGLPLCPRAPVHCYHGHPRAIGQSDMTREYIASLREGPHSMPLGPVFLQVTQALAVTAAQVESVLGALETELIQGQPEVNKIATLSRVRGLFPDREPFWAAYGNKAHDMLAYKVGKRPILYSFVQCTKG